MAGDLAGLSALAPTSSLIELTPGPNMAIWRLLRRPRGVGRAYAAVPGMALALVGVAEWMIAKR